MHSHKDAQTEGHFLPEAAHLKMLSVLWVHGKLKHRKMQSQQQAGAITLSYMQDAKQVCVCEDPSTALTLFGPSKDISCIHASAIHNAFNA